MRQGFLVLLAILSISYALPGNVNTAISQDGMTFNYSIYEGMIYVEAMITNMGGIGIGFGGQKMVGVDVAHLWYENGAVKIVDRNYINPPGAGKTLTDTERGGTNDFTDNGSTFDPNTNAWKTNFSRKLKTGDQYDNEIVDGANIQISMVTFKDQTSWGDMHTKAFYKPVMLTSMMQGDVAFTSKLTFVAGILMALFLSI